MNNDLTPVERTRLRRFLAAFQLSALAEFRGLSVQSASHIQFLRWLVEENELTKNGQDGPGWHSGATEQRSARS